MSRFSGDSGDSRNSLELLISWLSHVGQPIGDNGDRRALLEPDG
jgi:hypothetical protein